MTSALATGVLATGPALAGGGGEACEVTKLFAPDGVEGDAFGHASSVDGNWLVVGAPLDDDRTGSAHVYALREGAWAWHATLRAADREEHDSFGSSVSVSGNRVVVGAPLDGDRGDWSGSAYVFALDGVSWSLEAKLVAFDGRSGDLFGESVGIHGDAIIVGAMSDDDRGGASGSGYVYRFGADGWALEAKILASDGAPGDWFGNAVAIHGDVAVVGARHDGDRGAESGSAYVFRFDGARWNEEAKLLASDGIRADQFGFSIATDATHVIVGAIHLDTRPGAAYVYRHEGGTTWSEAAKLSAPDGASRDSFGHSVAIAATTAVVGASSHDHGRTHAGAAYVYRRDHEAWSLETELRASDREDADTFGASTAIRGACVFVGASRADGRRGQNTGASYVFDLAICLCDADLDGSGAVDSADVALILAAWGEAGGPADLDDSGVVDFGDLLIALADWGPCA